MSGFKLYEISQLLQDAIDAVEAAVHPETGEIPDDWAEFLDAIQLERDQKVLDCAKYLKGCLAEAGAIKEEIDRLQARRKACERRADSIKKYLQSVIQTGEKLKDAAVSISWRKSESVEILSEFDVPDEFCKIVREPSKSAIKDALKSGQNLPFAQLKTNNNIQIR